MTKRSSGIAVQPWEERGFLLWGLLGRYDRDPGFAAALGHLFAESEAVREYHRSEWWEVAFLVKLAERGHLQRPGEQVDRRLLRYVKSVRHLASRWGLDRLEGDETELGSLLIHRWCGNRLEFGQRGAFSLAQGVPVGGALVEVGAYLSPTDRDPEPLVQFTGRWDPRKESRGDARERLGLEAAAQIQRELDRLTVDAIAKGYTFVNPRETERDLDWLYALMARGATVAGLAAASLEEQSVAAGQWASVEVPERAMVAQAVRRMARKVGVSTRGWKLSRQ